MVQKFINDPEDMRWLRDVHLPSLGTRYKSAVIYGNEDWPDKIEVYFSHDPAVTDRPLVFRPDTSGKFHARKANVTKGRRASRSRPGKMLATRNNTGGPDVLPPGFEGFDFFPEYTDRPTRISPETVTMIQMEKMFGGQGYVLLADQVLRDFSLVPNGRIHFWPAKKAWYVWSGKKTRAEAASLGKKIQKSLLPENHPKQTMLSIHKDVLYVGYPGGYVALKPIKVKAMPPTREEKIRESERRRISSLLEPAESGADPAAWRENPRKSKRPIYATTYCNRAHDIYTGLPIHHECDQLSPISLMLEREFEPSAVYESIGSSRSFRPGEFELAEAIDEGDESAKDDLEQMYQEEVQRLGLKRENRGLRGTKRLGRRRNAEPIKLEWGLQPPPSVEMAWGARAIYDPGQGQYAIDLVPDRKSIVGGTDKEREALYRWLDTKGLKAIKHHALQNLDITSDETVGWSDGIYTIAASPKASHGYLYIVAFPALPGTVAEPMPKAERRKVTRHRVPWRFNARTTARTASGNDVAANELAMFASNDADLYNQQRLPIERNLAKKMQKGVYDHAKAVKLWMYFAESAAKKYAKEHGGTWHTMFPVPTRRLAAESFATEFETEAKVQGLDRPQPRRGKKNPRGRCIQPRAGKGRYAICPKGTASKPGKKCLQPRASRGKFSTCK